MDRDRTITDTMTTKKTTIKDIANEAGVSIALVSFVMSNQGKDPDERLYKVSEETSRRIASSSASERVQVATNVLNGFSIIPYPTGC